MGIGIGNMLGREGDVSYWRERERMGGSYSKSIE